MGPNESTVGKGQSDDGAYTANGEARAVKEQGRGNRFRLSRVRKADRIKRRQGERTIDHLLDEKENKRHPDEAEKFGNGSSLILIEQVIGQNYVASHCYEGGRARQAPSRIPVNGCGRSYHYCEVGPQQRQDPVSDQVIEE